MTGITSKHHDDFYCLKSLHSYDLHSFCNRKQTFTFPIEKELTRIDKNGEEITKKISYRLQLIDSARFMVSWLWNLSNNFSEEIHKNKCKYRHDDKNCETWEINHKYCDCFFLEYTNFKDVYQYAKTNNKYMKYYDKNKELSFLKY